MKKLIRILNTIASICAGMTLSSLLITESETWKWSLPICLLCVTFVNVIKE
jgi:uncharacterized membrane protein YccC